MASFTVKLTVRPTATLGGLRARSVQQRAPRVSARVVASNIGPKHQRPVDADLGCPDSESGMCEVTMRHHDRMLGAPDSETGMVSSTYDSDVFDRPSRPRMHVVGHHLIHSDPACPAMGCPESESGFCELTSDLSEEHEELGAWEF